MENIKIIMKKSTRTDKPLITIAMAVYEPRLDWLCEQLESINAQTQAGLELNILDDCSQTVPFNEICVLVAKCIKAFPYTIDRNEANLGSNGTFERLTVKARGEYIAYCDQDDIWMPQKLERLLVVIRETDANLVCSDMLIMDEKGDVTDGSITAIRRHHIFHSGCGLAPKLLFHNWVTGCTMLLRTEIAKAAMPFCRYMVHDHWLALFCAESGKLICLPKPLIKYRIHHGNQTLMMAGVHDKESYIEIKIKADINKLEWMVDNFRCSDEVNAMIRDGLIWARARETNMRRKGGKRTVWKYRRFSPLISIFEVFASVMPDRLFLRIVEMKRMNKI